MNETLSHFERVIYRLCMHGIAACAGQQVINGNPDELRNTFDSLFDPRSLRIHQS